ncbi:MAG: NUDIX hydrolase, partial [Clostridia bacterium]|nr:NUDIX hydrolase [Clostridia bacterium]
MGSECGRSAQLGEDPEDCAKRELFEETGILCNSFELVKITFSNRSPSLIYSYLAKVDCDKNSVVLQEGETTEYKWVDAAGLIEYAESELAIKSSVERYKSFYDKVRAQISMNITDMELSHISEYAELFISVF